MKDLGLVKQVLGIRITRDRKTKILWLSQEKYIEKALAKFCMNKRKLVDTPLVNHFSLTSKQCPSTYKEKEGMKKLSSLLDNWFFDICYGLHQA